MSEEMRARALETFYAAVEIINHSDIHLHREFSSEKHLRTWKDGSADLLALLKSEDAEPEPDETWWGFLEIELGLLEEVAKRIREGTLWNNEATEIQSAVGKIRVATREARAYLPKEQRLE